MRFRSTVLPAIAAALCCMSCVKTGGEIGGSFIPVSHSYTVKAPDAIELSVEMRSVDLMRNYSQTRITIGSIRDDASFGLSRRASVVTLVPLHKSLDFGDNPRVKRFHFTAAADSFSVSEKAQSRIIQNVNVYELDKAVTAWEDDYCNTPATHGAQSIVKGTPVINGTDSLSFDFSDEFAQKYLDVLKNELEGLEESDFAALEPTERMKAYLEKLPGIYIDTDDPAGQGGRFNIFQLQLGVDIDYGYLNGSYAELSLTSDYGDRTGVDTSFFFYFSPDKFFDVDSLVTNSATGSFPQHALNFTIQDAAASSAHSGTVAGEEILVEGGGGLKAVIPAAGLKQAAVDAISAAGDDPSKVIINKARLSLSYKAPDHLFEKMYKMPAILSPTRCISDDDGHFQFAGITDASASDENQGDINRSLMKYTPDITYYMQDLISNTGSGDKKEKFESGEYDLWLLIMSQETVTTTTASNSELSDYYSALAYQSYYNNMYGGYGGYGGYGYGDYYSNYYSYMMAAMYAGSSSTSTSVTVQLDMDRFYSASLYGPAAEDATLRPQLQLTYSVPGK